MRTITEDMNDTVNPAIALPSAEMLAAAMLERIAEQRRVRQVAAELAPRVELALGLRRSAGA